jgi:amino acid transporter
MATTETTLDHSSLGFWRSLAQPIAAQAPSAGIALIPATMAAVTGTYGTMSFVLGLIAGLFLAYVFYRLARRVVSAGSVYSFARLMLGPAFAFIVAWAYMANDIFVGSGIVSQASDYLGSAISMTFGTSVFWIIFAVVIWFLVVYFASRKVKLSTTLLLAVEAISSLLVIIGGIIVLTKGGYGGHNFGFSAFSLKGVSMSSLFFGVSVAFLGFGGFEQATALGEETKNAKATIPLTIWVAIIFSALLYIFGSWFEAVGFKNSAALAASATPLFSVISAYVSPTMAAILAFSTTISAFSAALALTLHGTRLLYALFRDGFINRSLAAVHQTQRSPITAVYVFAIPLFVFSIGFFWTSSANAFNWVATGGGVFLSIAYFLLAVAAIVYFFRERRVFTGVVAVIAALIIGYALYSSVYPIPSFPFNVVIYVVALLLLVGIAIIAFNGRLRKALTSASFGTGSETVSEAG